MVDGRARLGVGLPEVRLHSGSLAVERLHRHTVSWSDINLLAAGGGGADVVRQLRLAERSRRLLLLRSVMDEVSKAPELAGPLPGPDDAWELLIRVQEQAPDVLVQLLSHPYLGSWAGYTSRLLAHRINGAFPVWVHVGHMHALAAAAAIVAELDFETDVPLVNGGVMLPMIGWAALPADDPYSIAQVRADGGQVSVRHGSHVVKLPADQLSDAANWRSVRRLSVHAGGKRLSVRLDDLDPYRGLYEPVAPQRLDEFEVESWRHRLAEAWQLIVRYLPEIADGMLVGLDSLVPRPAVPFRQPSASTGEAFGSAIIALPADAAEFAATLVHEFQHIRLGGLLHVQEMHDSDSRERFYTGWRDDPRPVAGVLQGVYAFFGVAAFWRAMAKDGEGPLVRRAQFEFAYWRAQTWRTLAPLRGDCALTDAGRKFAEGIAEVLGPWQDEPLPLDLLALARACASDHHAVWRIRFIRPDPATVKELSQAWRCGQPPPQALRYADSAPTPVPDGRCSRARFNLIRLVVSDPGSVQDRWEAVPDATSADLAYATGRFADAECGFRAELAADPDRPASWVGLGLALAARQDGVAARTLLRCPELVRAVHREIRAGGATAPAPDELASWIGRMPA